MPEINMAIKPFMSFLTTQVTEQVSSCSQQRVGGMERGGLRSHVNFFK